jgi:hypothetical protein
MSDRIISMRITPTTRRILLDALLIAEQMSRATGATDQAADFASIRRVIPRDKVQVVLNDPDGNQVEADSFELDDGDLEDFVADFITTQAGEGLSGSIEFRLDDGTDE